MVGNDRLKSYSSIQLLEKPKMVVQPGVDPDQMIVNSPADMSYVVTKRLFDVVCASGALLLLLPVFALVALAIVLENSGPVFFHQTRVGRNGRHFKFYKFRSMVTNAEELKRKLEAENEATGPIFKMKNDPRITRVGRILRKYSIDELPQLLNVLRGEMSFVGPRPHLPKEVALYSEGQHKRLAVQPGLVCLREVTGRSELTFEKWIETDIQYIAKRSFLMDLSILARLIPAVIMARGAY